MLKLVLHRVTTVLRKLNTRHSRRRTEKRWPISRYFQLRYQVETNNGSLQLGFIIQEWKILQYDILQWQPTLDVLTGYISPRPTACISGYYSF